MNKYLCFFLSSGFAIGCGKTRVERVEVPRIPQFAALKDISSADANVQEKANAVIRIAYSGTGFFISDSGLLMTNEHVVGSKNCPKSGCIRAVYFNRQRDARYRKRTLFFEPVTVDPELDVAVYQLREFDGSGSGEKIRTPHFLKLSSTPAEELIGQAVTMIGHPHAALKKYTTGRVIERQNDWILYDIFSLGGNSGSPVLSESGEVVAIHHRSQDGKYRLSRTQFAGLGIGSASTAILASINPEGLTLAGEQIQDDDQVALSLTDTATLGSEEFFAHRTLYRFSRTNPFHKDVALTNQGGMVKLFADRCREALEWPNDRPADDFASSLHSRCLNVFRWLNCQPSADRPYGECPNERSEILSIGMSAALKMLDLHANSGVVSLAYLAYQLEDNRTDGSAKLHQTLETFAESSGEPLERRLVSVRLWNAQDEMHTHLAGQDLVRHIDSYRERPTSEDLYWTVDAATGLRSSLPDLISRERLVSLYQQALEDPNMPLGRWLTIEEWAYIHELL